MGTLRFFEEVVSFKIRRTFGFADYKFTTRKNPKRTDPVCRVANKKGNATSINADGGAPKGSSVAKSA